MVKRDPMFGLEKALPLRVLSEDDWQQWKTKGYVIVRDAAPKDAVERLKPALFAFCGIDPDDPATWGASVDGGKHHRPELVGSGMVEIFHHQAMWDIRQSQRVYDAFVDVWDREDLWVNPNRANLLAPARGERRFDGFVHWDLDTSLEPIPFKVQGVVSLVDTSLEVGGTWGYPDLYQHFDEWVKTQPADRDPFKPDPDSIGEPVFFEMRAGDLLIFNSLLAHGVAPNRSADKFRMAIYVAMHPAMEDDDELCRQRIEAHLERKKPKPVYPGDPRGWERDHYGPAHLTELGERLLGMRRWSDKVRDKAPA